EVEMELIEPLRVLWIDAQLGEVERARRPVRSPGDGAPGGPAVVRANERARAVQLDQRKDGGRTRWRVGDADAPELAFRQTVRGAAADPSFAAVRRGVEPRTRTAGAEIPRPAADLPERRDQPVRIARVERQVGGSRPLVEIERPPPALPAVLRAVDAALATVAPERTERGHPGDLGVGRMEHDARDPFARGQPEPGPGGAAVDRAVDAVAGRGRVADVALAGPRPDDPRIGLKHRERADRG